MLFLTALPNWESEFWSYARNIYDQWEDFRPQQTNRQRVGVLDFSRIEIFYGQPWSTLHDQNQPERIFDPY
jgi:hypothetical protein